MQISKLFRKKSIENILQQVEKDAQAKGDSSLSKQLGVKDLTAFGIAAIIGAGIFTTIGKASADGGPAVVFLFIFTAIACGFAAFAYAEFASMVPVSGSAYTYSYVAFGELTAWIIGWALIMEYAIGNITVAIGWSEYFTGFLASGGIHIPAWMTMDYITASKGFQQSLALMQGGKLFENLDKPLQNAYTAWNSAPVIGSFHCIANIPALGIIIFITWLVYKGMKESKNASNLMVLIKLCIVLLVIAVGVFYVDADNWSPFAPNGILGILKGVSAVFFAYIGFDAISTTAEECKNPQRDLPRGMMWAIIICTVLYIAIALVLTGMVKYNQLDVADPLAEVFKLKNLKWMSGIIGLSAIVAMASVLLVFQMGQPRIWMSMSRDGLLPKAFSKIHPKYHTPSFSTSVTGFIVAGGALFLNINTVTDLCSIGTLFAFVLVCAGVLSLQNNPNIKRGRFKTPYINSKFVMPFLVLAAILLLFKYNKTATIDFITNTQKVNNAETIVTSLNAEELIEVKNFIVNNDSIVFAHQNNDVEAYMNTLTPIAYENTVAAIPIAMDKKYEKGWNLFKHKIPLWIFICISLILTFYSVKKNFSLIPLLGLLSCLYMMAELGIANWIGFFIWLTIGLVVYFTYSIKHSKLNIESNNQ